MTINSITTQGRKHSSVIVFAATVLALGIGALGQPTQSHAEAIWDVGAWDKCVKAANKTYEQTGDDKRLIDEYKFCCQTTGGEFHPTQGCTAPPLTGPPPPEDVIQAPGTGTATQESPVSDAQPQAPVPPTSMPTPTTKRYSPGWGI
ncbi:hypothetical protein M4D79_16985 [Mycolicibacterium novocastrense]|nr:hypothetical protein M4D79_16985 [Mycolicibacterium novocastrense]